MMTLFWKMIKLFWKMITLFWKMITLFRKMITLFRKMMLFSKMITLFRKMITLFRKMITLLKIAILKDCYFFSLFQLDILKIKWSNKIITAKLMNCPPRLSAVCDLCLKGDHRHHGPSELPEDLQRSKTGIWRTEEPVQQGSAPRGKGKGMWYGRLYVRGHLWDHLQGTAKGGGWAPEVLNTLN